MRWGSLEMARPSRDSRGGQRRLAAVVWWLRQRPGAPSAAASIAVLPFVNMSADKEQEYFSDGLTEEMLSSLAKIPGLHVAGRTSAFQFKGKHEDLRVIGQKLNVATVLEGSVRRGRPARAHQRSAGSKSTMAFICGQRPTTGN